MGGPGYEKNGGILGAVGALSSQVENFVVADEDEFGTAVAAVVNTERWTGEEFIVGAGSTSTANINTTTAGKAYVAAIPGGAAPPTGYWLRHKISRKSRFYSVVVDLNITWGTMVAGADLAGIYITKGATYDANNFLFFARQKSAIPQNNLAISGVLGGGAIGAIQVAVTADAIALKVERFNNIWTFWYSTAMHPDYVWTFAGQVEDTTNALTSVTSLGLAAYSSGTLLNTVKIDFDYFAYYISSQSIFQALANGYDSSLVASDRDGDLMSRTEFIIEALDAESLLVVGTSQDGPCEHDNLEAFEIYLYDKRSGAILLANIAIGAITQTMEQSHLGAAFSVAGITQPIFAKNNGIVYDHYRFLAAEWDVGDMYKLTISGITATIDGEVLPIRAISWSGAVVEVKNIDSYVKANSFNDGVWMDSILGTAGTTYPIGTPTTPVAGLADALTIATARKVSKIYLVQGSLALPAGTWSNFQFIGTNPGCGIDIANRTSTNAQFINLTLTGTSPSVIHAKECIIQSTLLLGASSFFERCRVNGLTVNAISTTQILDNCYFNAANIDVNSNTTTSLRFFHASGALVLGEMVDAPSNVDIYSDTLQMEVAVSNTLGTVQIWGKATVINNTGGATVLIYKDTALATALNARLQSKIFWSVVQPTLTLTAASVVHALPDVVLPNYAWTIVRAFLVFKFRKTEDTSGARNNLNGDSYIEVKASASVPYVHGIFCGTNIWDTQASSESGGDCIVGTYDVVAKVDVMNDTYNFETHIMAADGANLVLHDVQTGIMLWYYPT